MEARLGHDFGRVRVHTDEPAARSAHAVGALAYTVGSSIVFGRGRFRPNEREGRRLLAHELVHTVQQGAAEPGGAGLRLDRPSDTAEREARAVGAAPSFRSPALAIRARLRAGTVLQRAIPTSGGEWDTDNYVAQQDVDANGQAVAPAAGARGADITLKFMPDRFAVNAESIGLVQSVQSYVSGALNLTPAAATRAIPAADAIPINTGAGETDEGTAIDMAAGYNNPVYPVQSQHSASLSDPNVYAPWGQLGCNYTDGTNTKHHKDATLVDTPRRSGAQNDSRQIFEVTALATKGVQAGTYYGSVRWGWRTDHAGNLSKIPLQKVSDGTPSSTFIKAAGIWDKGKSSIGAQNVKLGMPQVMVTIVPVTFTPQAVVMLPFTLPVGTRLVVERGFGPPYLPNTGTVKIVDGPHTGLVGDISEPNLLLPVLTVERP